MTSKLFDEISHQIREGIEHDNALTNAAKDSVSRYANEIIEIEVERGLQYSEKVKDWAKRISGPEYHELVHLTEVIDESLFSISKKIRRLNT